MITAPKSSPAGAAAVAVGGVAALEAAVAACSLASDATPAEKGSLAGQNALAGTRRRPLTLILTAQTCLLNPTSPRAGLRGRPWRATCSAPVIPVMIAGNALSLIHISEPTRLALI
eukprot:133492-Alexandrium_andersonii.AAC.1